MSTARPSDGYASPAGAGWLLFAGIILMVAAVLNVIYGIAAIGDSKFFIADQKYILSNLNTWGWVTLILGVIQVLRGAFDLGRQPVRPLVRDHRREPERDRGAALDSRLSVLVAGDLLARHPRHLRPRGLRRAASTGLSTSETGSSTRSSNGRTSSRR